MFTEFVKAPVLPRVAARCAGLAVLLIAVTASARAAEPGRDPLAALRALRARAAAAPSGRPQAAPPSPAPAVPLQPLGCPVTRSVTQTPNAVFYDGILSQYDSFLVPPITTYNTSAVWQSVNYPDDNPITAMVLTVNLSADLTCAAPCNADPGYRATGSAGCTGSDPVGTGCTKKIAPLEFQIGLKGPDGTYYPLLDRVGDINNGSDPAQIGAATLCMKFYHNQAPTNCAGPPVALGYTTNTLAGVLGKNIHGDWRLMVTRTDSLATGGVSYQGGATLTSFTLDPTLDASCTPDFRLISTGLATDRCETLGPGDSNGALDPRETGTFKPQIFNNSSVTATGVTVTLSSSSGLLTFNNNTQPVANIASGQTLAPVTGVGVTVGDSGTCQSALPLTVTVAATGLPGGQALATVLNEGIQGSSATTVAQLIDDVSAANTPSIWRVSNDTGAVYNATPGIQQFDYTSRCTGANPGRDWPFWKGTFSGTPPFNNTVPFLLGSLYSNTACASQADPLDSTGGTIQPVCFTPVTASLAGLLGFGGSQNVPFVLLDASYVYQFAAANIDFGPNTLPPGGNTPLCNPLDPASNLRGLDTRLTSPPVSLASFTGARVLFDHDFWMFWDLILTGEAVMPGYSKRDQILTVEVASSITDAGVTCPLESGSCGPTSPAGTCRRWCEAYRIQNQSTPGLRSELVDLTAFAAGATNVQVRFRFRDSGWWQQRFGDYFEAVRNIRLQGVNATVACNRCGNCAAPTFSGLSGATDVDGCLDTGVNVTFNNQSNQSLWGDCAGGVNCAPNQPLRSFRIFRSDNPGTPLTTITWTSATSFSFNDNTATNATNFTYSAAALNACGLSTTGAATLVAQDHLGVVPVFTGVATATDASVCVNSGNALTWALPSDFGDGTTGGSTTRLFTLQRNQGAGFTTFTTVSGSTTSATDPSPTPAVAATYQIIARNRCNLSTTGLQTASATDNSDVVAPGVVGNERETKSGGNVNLTWNAASDPSGISGYKVYGAALPTPLTAVIGTPATTAFSDTLASANKYYQVTAVDTCVNEGGR